MAKDKKYRLVFLFELTDKGAQKKLENGIKRVLVKHLQQQSESPHLQLEKISEDTLRVEVKGSLRDVDACHGKIDKEICSDGPHFIRLADDVSDELRKKAYPLLSNLEQKVRTFINESMVKVEGFSWWDKLGVESVRKRASEVQDKSNRKGLRNHHQIEFTEFNHLIEIVTGNLASWKEDKTLTVSEFQHLLSKNSTLEELREDLAKKTERKTLWDTVFSRFFENEDQWKQAEQNLTKVIIPLRNKAMHHRPILLWEFEEFEKANKEVLKALEGKQRELGQQAKADLKKQAEELLESFRQGQKQYQQLFEELQGLQSPSKVRADFEKLLDSLQQSIHPSQEIFERVQESLLPVRQAEERLNELTRQVSASLQIRIPEQLQGQLDEIHQSSQNALAHIQESLGPAVELRERMEKFWESQTKKLSLPAELQEEIRAAGQIPEQLSEPIKKALQPIEEMQKSIQEILEPIKKK